MSNLAISLWISLIGIILIFVAILILWGAMELLVRITTPKKKVVEAEMEEVEEAEIPTAAGDSKRKAAAAAVTVALAFQKSSASLTTAPESSELSAWQVAPLQK
ncbi:MAG: hypothetical protein K8R77_00575 [Anaerolineaceae bacterium]|nr:hypothetical protein [Anaerolineaceae bacterium]